VEIKTLMTKVIVNASYHDHIERIFTGLQSCDIPCKVQQAFCFRRASALTNGRAEEERQWENQRIQAAKWQFFTACGHYFS
jgi:hypothetical protein